MTHGDPQEGLKIIQRIWDNTKPAVYTPEQISEETERVVQEVITNGIINYG